MAKRQLFLMVSQSELYWQFFLKYALGHVFNICSSNKKMSQVRSGTFVGYGLMNDYCSPYDWPTIPSTCFEMRCLYSCIVQCFCTSFKGPSMWKQCDRAVKAAGGRAGSLIKEGAKLGRSASVSRASFVFRFQQPLKMCDAYCKQ